VFTRRNWIVLLSVALLVGACASPAATPTTSSAPATSFASQASAGGSPTTSSAPVVVKIGNVGSVSGATAFYGQEAIKGAQIAIDELNAKGGPTSYEMVTADDACSTTGGAAAYGKLIDLDKVDVILGSPCSAAALGGVPLLKAAQIPNLIVSSTSPVLTQEAGAGGNPYIWRMCLGDDVMAKYFSSFIAKQGVTKIATIVVNNAYGQGAVVAYVADFPTDGVQVVDQEVYTQGGGDFRAQLTHIHGSGAQAMLIIGAHQDAAVMMKQFQELGMSIKVYARGDIVSSSFQDAAGNPHLGDGIIEADNWDSTYQAYSAFETAYHAKYGGTAQSYAVQAYLGTLLLDQAVTLGGGGSAAQIQDGLGKVNWQSPIGPMVFDDHHQAHHDMFLLEFVNGQIQVLQRIPTSTQ
jgi:branched-chain amino acid transport system substrate-binding protein